MFLLYKNVTLKIAKRKLRNHRTFLRGNYFFVVRKLINVLFVKFIRSLLLKDISMMALRVYYFLYLFIFFFH